jgi:AraC-like DNA-binding protein
VPLAWFLQCHLPPKLVERLLGGHLVSETHDRRFELDRVLCRQWQHELERTRGEPTLSTTLDLHARLLRLAATLPELPVDRLPARVVLTEGGATKAEQMASYVARHYQEAVSADQVARDMHLHPNYAMTLFKRTFHTTLIDYLTHYRIAQAQRLLVTTDEKVVDIALESGFRTMSRFYEAFERACGCSPTRYRNDHQLGD